MEGVASCEDEVEDGREGQQPCLCLSLAMAEVRVEVVLWSAWRYLEGAYHFAASIVLRQGAFLQEGVRGIKRSHFETWT